MKPRRLLAAGVLTVAIAVGASTEGGAEVVQADRNRAAVVVDLGGGDVRTACVTFDGSTISGVEALRLAGFDPVTQSFGGRGTAVCALCGKGCGPGSGCLTCQQPDYWGYWPGYRYSQAGAGATRVGDGDVEAWRWGTGEAPTRVAYSRICVPLTGPTTTRPRPAATTTSPPSTAAPQPGPGAGPGPAPSTAAAPSTTTGSPSSSASSTSSTTTTTAAGEADAGDGAERAAGDAAPVAVRDQRRAGSAGDDEDGPSAVPSAVGFAVALAGVGLLILRARARNRSRQI